MRKRPVPPHAPRVPKPPPRPTGRRPSVGQRVAPTVGPALKGPRKAGPIKRRKLVRKGTGINGPVARVAPRLRVPKLGPCIVIAANAITGRMVHRRRAPHARVAIKVAPQKGPRVLSMKAATKATLIAEGPRPPPRPRVLRPQGLAPPPKVTAPPLGPITGVPPRPPVPLRQTSERCGGGPRVRGLTPPAPRGAQARPGHRPKPLEPLLPQMAAPPQGLTRPDHVQLARAPPRIGGRVGLARPATAPTTARIAALPSAAAMYAPAATGVTAYPRR